jgi:hypothetical protein
MSSSIPGRLILSAFSPAPCPSGYHESYWTVGRDGGFPALMPMLMCGQAGVELDKFVPWVAEGVEG